MHVTVAICTFNRAAMLRRTLATMAQLVPAQDCTWELLVVDNASTDATPDVLREFRDVLPLRSIVEPTAGVANARNTATASARGDYLLATDDDVFVEPRWMAAYVEAFRAHPEAAFFGGGAEPLFEAPTPSWLTAVLPYVGTVFALRRVPTAAPITPSEVPFGLNVAYRLDVLRTRRFDPQLGHTHGYLMLGEDTTMVRDLLAAGETGWWVPEARVHHVIPVQRQTWSHLEAYWFAQGRWAAQIASAKPPARPPTRLLGRPVRLWIRALVQQARYALRRLRHSRAQLVDEIAQTRRLWGALEGFRAQR